MRLPDGVDITVVGAGAIGLSAALAMRGRGACVLVLEADRPGGAQSAGPGRVFRLIHESDRLVELAQQAHTAWREVEARFGEALLGSEGTLLVGDVTEHARRLTAAGAAFEVLDASGLARTMPLLAAGPAEGLLDVAGGAIDAAGYMDLLRHEMRDAIQLAEVTSLATGDSGVTLETSRGVTTAQRVLVAAGAGTLRLARQVGLDIPLTTSVHHRVAYPVEPARPLPCLLERSGLFGARAYGVPLPGDAFAVGCATFDGLEGDQAIAETSAYVGRALPGVEPCATHIVRCDSTVLGGHPESFALYQAGPIAAFAGGNLFKFAPLLGHLLARAVLDAKRDVVLDPALVT